MKKQQKHEATRPNPRLRLVTVRDLSRTAPFSETSLRQLIFKSKANGLAPAVIRLGRRVLIDLDQFEAWLEQHRQERIEENRRQDHA